MKKYNKYNVLPKYATAHPELNDELAKFWRHKAAVEKWHTAHSTAKRNGSFYERPYWQRRNIENEGKWMLKGLDKMGEDIDFAVSAIKLPRSATYATKGMRMLKKIELDKMKYMTKSKKVRFLEGMIARIRSPDNKGRRKIKQTHSQFVRLSKKYPRKEAHKRASAYVDAYSRRQRAREDRDEDYRRSDKSYAKSAGVKRKFEDAFMPDGPPSAPLAQALMDDTYHGKGADEIMDFEI